MARRPPEPELVQQWVSQYRSGVSASAIAREHGCSVSRICYWLDREGVPRDQPHSAPGKQSSGICRRCGGPLDKGTVRKRCGPCGNERHRKWRLLHNYGLTEDQFDVLVEAQGGACAICRKQFVATPHVDHDHACCPGKVTCGKCVRGLLCFRCNYSIGYLGEDNVVRAADYLQRAAVACP